MSTEWCNIKIDIMSLKNYQRDASICNHRYIDINKKYFLNIGKIISIFSKHCYLTGDLINIKSIFWQYRNFIKNISYVKSVLMQFSLEFFPMLNQYL